VSAVGPSDADRTALRTAASTRSAGRGAPSYVRANLSLALVAADVLMAVLALSNVHGPGRVGFGLAFCVVVPGWSIVGLLHLDNPPLEAGLTPAASLASLVVLGQLATSLGGWHLTFLQFFLCALCLPSLLYQATDRRHRSRRPA
jgi:hypothetical protein